jgi:hypothetical protein
VNGWCLIDPEPSSLMPVELRFGISPPHLVSTEESCIGFYCHKNPPLWPHRKPLQAGLGGGVDFLTRKKMIVGHIVGT